MDEQWDVVSKKLILDRSPYVKLWDEEVRLPDGRVIPDWLRVELPHYVQMFALTDDNSVLFVRRYKHGAGTMVLGLPGGYLDPGEEPLAAAQRELLEEAGLASENWTSLGTYLADANREAGHGHLFLARMARRVAEPDAGDLEALELSYVPLEEVRGLWRSGAIIELSCSAIIGLALDELYGH
jgi:ADP-ribose pyrophosphatase